MLRRTIFVISALALVAACETAATTQSPQAANAAPTSMRATTDVAFEQDRRAILAMAGDFNVRFDFMETVPLAAGYEPKERYVTGGTEVVRVIEDRGDFISLQHILVVGDDEKFPIKHWRQDWAYEPSEVLVFIGGNAWEMRAVPPAERAGKWSQTVYQVDDSPRYGAVGAWAHDNDVAQWTPPAEWRPLPRRDMTKRDDYHAVVAVNRHTITPFGWAHEQENTKLALNGAPRALVREIGVNTYARTGDFDADVAIDYWAATSDYWASVRAQWARLEASGAPFALTLKGEPADLYAELLGLAGEVEAGEKTNAAAAAEALRAIDTYTTEDVPPLQDRLRPMDDAVRAASARD